MLGMTCNEMAGYLEQWSVILKGFMSNQSISSIEFHSVNSNVISYIHGNQDSSLARRIKIGIWLNMNATVKATNLGDTDNQIIILPGSIDVNSSIQFLAKTLQTLKVSLSIIPCEVVSL